MNTSLDPLEHNSKPKNLSYCTCKYIRDNTHLMIIKAFIHIHIQVLLKINTINEKIIIVTCCKYLMKKLSLAIILIMYCV